LPLQSATTQSYQAAPSAISQFGGLGLTGAAAYGMLNRKAGGIIKTMTNKTTKVVGAKPDHNSAPTGDVKMGNAGGYKKGGAAKKHFATGGVVDTGRAVAMPKKAPSKPVAISQLAGTFKKGGRVC
jgi:hypothetical protein